MSRWKASGIHFLISLFIAIAAIAIVILVMYPPPYTGSAGAGRLLVILISVDVTLGPLITLIIFKQGKPGLKFDLSVIAMLQVAALGYGLIIIGQARPVFLAFVEDRFALVHANAIKDDAIAQASAPYNRKSWTGPVLVGTQLSGDIDAHNDVLMSAMEGGPDIDSMPQYYVPYEQQKEKVLAQAKPLKDLRSWSENADTLVATWLERKQTSAEDFLYLPLQVRTGFHTLVLNQNVEPIDVLPVDPW